MDDYAVLKEKSAAATTQFNDLNDKIKVADNRMNEISALQKHIGNYSRTRDVYAQYKQFGYSKRFYDTHAADIILHQAAKKHFDSIGLKKLPSMQSLLQEYAILSTEKKKYYNEYRQVKDEMRELLTAKSNVDRLLKSPSIDTYQA